MKKITLLIILLLSAVCHAQMKSGKDVFDTARYGTVAEMKQLEAKDKNIINSVSPMGFTPLILACYRGNTEVAEYLAKHVKDINYKSDNGTALAAAAVKGDINMAKVLLENKADPNIADPLGVTPLVYAVQFENTELIKLLLEYKASKTYKDKEGRTPLDHADFTKNQEVINLLKN
ncbi:ankyrin repeat domain-containing protein [Flavobacterium salilacus subsp. salilacus]|uniref:ankyrin repeat domain-containing protein n=1 Tax=Flavobacterium TaxID=237 RepID=UPI0010753AF2|nr:MULTISPECIES: ankyrin repeat domain-containing protein [Flavobacterium]KAF2515825.1 ankyrin repeat domain-containing protein [Flavobacterium salilacus subsp. salilacus]MBE1615371.1 ankyrin repeat domain-containing protein [Flavobacterium sp. SaA2.13]